MTKKPLEKHEEIEHLITKTYRARIYSRFVKALKEYQLLKPNDHVCVCISGGKDSMLLAKLFQILNKHSDFPFKVTYLVMNPGYNEANLKLIQKNLNILQIPAVIKETNIFEIANAQDKSPCFLCAKMRRGALYNIAKSLGCNKIALGHHYDDVIETTLMNLLNSGSFQTMLPKLHSTNYQGMELIRPMYFIREKDIISWKKKCELEFLQCACKFVESSQKENSEINSQRLATKKLIHDLISYNKQVEKNIFKSASNVNLDMILGYKKGLEKISFLDHYDDEIKN